MSSIQPRALLYGITSLFLWLFSISAIAENKPATMSNEPAPTAPHEVTSQVCGSCHVEIYNEWKGTMHGQSTALNDPIHAAFYKKVIGDPREEGVVSKKGKYPVCLKCHAPNAAIQKKTKIDAQPAFAEGINCVYCHTISGFKGTRKEDGTLRLGQAAYKNSTTHLQAPSGKNYTTTPQPEGASGGMTTPFHPFPMEGGNSALYKSNALCMGCHDQRNNGHGVPLCATGDEYAESKAQVNCQSCHMPMVNGHASHSWAGGHDKNMMRKAVQLNLAVEKAESGHKAKVTVQNLLPHKFPTGSPFRTAWLKLVGYDAAGKVVWQNYQTQPLKEDKQSVMVYTLGDGEGKPSMPPKAKEVLGDTRLKPHEARTLEYTIPAEGVTHVRAEIFYNLLTPKLLQNLDKVLTADLKEDKLAATAEVKL